VAIAVAQDAVNEVNRIACEKPWNDAVPVGHRILRWLSMAHGHP